MDAARNDSFLSLPCDSFGGMAEFREFRRTRAALLAARADRDRSHATARGSVAIAGTCGLCLHPATFSAETASGAFTSAGRMPAWRDQLRCDCEAALPAHQRAALTYVLGTLGVQPWYRVRLLGDDGRAAAVLRPLVADVAAAETSPADRHLVIAFETLPAASSIDDALATAAASLGPGGHFVFTCAFDPDLAFSAQSLTTGRPHRIGWDILTRVRPAGFRTAAALLYWSEEFAYLGGANFLFDAAR